MKCLGRYGVAILILVIFCPPATAKGKKPRNTPFHVAPPEPAMETQMESQSFGFQALSVSDQYLIGDPTDDEQVFVERINRARANAPDEGLRQANTSDPDIVAAIDQFGVDLVEMLSQFAALTNHLPPLSINTHLMDMARLHTQDMFDNAFQDHVSSSNPPAPFSAGDTLAARIAEFPYAATIAAENVFSYARSVEYGHASFEIDWGSGTYGMQDPPYHRLIIHDAVFKEIGVGVIRGFNTVGNETVGPLLVTQNFATQSGSPAFLTGVAYYDVNDNAVYDSGEGLSGAVVTTTAGPDWASTTHSGGYSVPIYTDGVKFIIFTVDGMDPLTEIIAVSGGGNVKADLRIQYTPLKIIGTLHPVTGVASSYSISPLPGASEYAIRVLKETSGSIDEGAESGTAGVTITQSAGYPVIQSERVQQGTYAFHLAHDTALSEEIILFNDRITPTSSSVLAFHSQLRWATDSQHARVEVSTDDGSTWETVFSQSGIIGTRESTYSLKSIPLSAYAGIPIHLRFRYTIEGNSYYNTLTTDFGWLFDTISISNLFIASTVVETTSATPIYNFTPTSDGTYVLQSAAINNSRQLPYGTLTRVTASALTAMQIWRAENFSPADLADPTKESTHWGDLADPDFDGLTNYMEFALMGDPNAPDVAEISPEFIESGSTLKLRYTKGRNDVIYQVISNDTLDSSSWTSSGVQQSPDPLLSHEGTIIEATVNRGTSRKFLQLELAPAY